jgi:hypothetical protein
MNMASQIINIASKATLTNIISGPVPYVVTGITLPLEFLSQKILEKLLSLPSNFVKKIINLFSRNSEANPIINQVIDFSTTHVLANKITTVISSNHLIGLGLGFLFDFLLAIGNNKPSKKIFENIPENTIFINLKTQLISNLQNYHKNLQDNQGIFLNIIDNPTELSSNLISMNFDFLENQIKSLALSYALLKNLKEDEVKNELENIMGVDLIKHQLQVIKENTTYLTKMGLLLYKVANNEIDIQYFGQQYSTILVKVVKEKLICKFSSNIFLMLEKLFNDSEVRGSILMDKVVKEIDFLKFLFYSTKLKAQDLVNKANDRINSRMNLHIGRDETEIIDECLIPLTYFLT